MTKLDESSLDALEERYPLAGRRVLQIGCGNGGFSLLIAARCRFLTAFDSDHEKIKEALTRQVSNAVFRLHQAELMPFRRPNFDMVIFTVSLRRFHAASLAKVLARAAAVAGPARPDKGRGHLVFMKPTARAALLHPSIEHIARLHHREGSSHPILIYQPL
jgi:ubiquinone/menaquinone biosynthesis C-methylase UbiE